jgi:hypothetical protein
MSTATALTMEELELEQAELLPSRETLCRWNYSCCCSYYSCNWHHSCNWYRPCHSDWRQCW